MIKKLHKIPDKVFFRLLIGLIILLNINYIDMPLRIVYTALTQNFIANNSYYKPLSKLRAEIKMYPDFYDEGEVGFVTDAKEVNAFGSEKSIKAFFISQYAVIPSVMKDEKVQKYLVGTFFDEPVIPAGYIVLNRVSDNMYLLKRKSSSNE